MLLDEFKKVVSEMLEVDEADVKPEASFADLGADSLDLVELVIALEEKFKIEIPDEDVDGLITVQDAINYLRAKGVASDGEVSDA